MASRRSWIPTAISSIGRATNESATPPADKSTGLHRKRVKTRSSTTLINLLQQVSSSNRRLQSVAYPRRHHPPCRPTHLLDTRWHPPNHGHPRQFRRLGGNNMTSAHRQWINPQARTENVLKHVHKQPLSTCFSRFPLPTADFSRWRTRVAIILHTHTGLPTVAGVLAKPLGGSVWGSATAEPDLHSSLSPHSSSLSIS